MEQSISILGSTGSIGRQTLDVLAGLPIRVAALAANRSAARMEEQCRRVHPRLAVLADEAAAADLRVRLADTDIRVAGGREGLLEAAQIDCDIVLSALMGAAGLEPALAAIALGRRIALANKETLVCAGALVTRAAAQSGAVIVPVDSEHSAIFQCLQGCRDRSQVRRLLLTASGGPFFGWQRAELEHVTARQALRHPNWSMGAKITIDSATMMNKGLELIEAMHLYQLPPEQISILVHRQSIVHSLVEFIDGAVLAQLGVPDMRIPIEYALTWPDRAPCPAPALDLLTCGPLRFEPPDLDNFPCLPLAMGCAGRGGAACAVMNAANEVAVEAFLQDQIGFYDIPALVQRAVDTLGGGPADTLEQILAADGEARALTRAAL